MSISSTVSSFNSLKTSSQGSLFGQSCQGAHCEVLPVRIVDKVNCQSTIFNYNYLYNHNMTGQMSVCVAMTDSILF